MKITQFDDTYTQKVGAGETTLVSGSSGGSNSAFGGDVTGSAGSLSVVGMRQTVSLSSNLAPSAAVGNVLTLVSVGGTPVAQFAVSSNSGGGSLTVEEVDGSPTDSAVTKIVFPNGTLSIVSHVATYTPSSSGALTQAYAGKNAIGATNETATNRKVLLKSVTLANDCLITDIEAYIDWGGGVDFVNALWFGIWADNAGTPRETLQVSQSPVISMLLDSVNGAGGDTNARWFGAGMGRWCVAGTYWIGVTALFSSTNVSVRFKYDAGSDKTYTSGGDWLADAGWYTVSNSSRDYSIRANTIR